MSLFSWQCQNPCRLSLTFIIDWRVVSHQRFSLYPKLKLTFRLCRVLLESSWQARFYNSGKQQNAHFFMEERIVNISKKFFTCQSCDPEVSWTVSCRRYLNKTKPDGNLRVSRRSPDLPSCLARWWEAPRWERTGWDSCHRCHGTCEAFWKHSKIENHHLNTIYARESRNNRHFFCVFLHFYDTFVSFN